jgi:hypothetical protein
MSRLIYLLLFVNWNHYEPASLFSAMYVNWVHQVPIVTWLHEIYAFVNILS